MLAHAEMVWIVKPDSRYRGERGIVVAQDGNLYSVRVYSDDTQPTIDLYERDVVSQDRDDYSDTEQRALVNADTGHGWCVRCDAFDKLSSIYERGGGLCRNCKPIASRSLVETQQYNTELWENFGMSGTRPEW